MTSDYSDRLNPMLVKELRQGLRKGLFTVVFMLLQGAMIFFVGINLLTNNSADAASAGGSVDGVVSAGLWIILLVITPLSALGSIQEEKKIQTLELVQMTRLGSQRIVLGKWVSVMSQAMLFAIAVIPYGVLRYFFGGMDVTENLSLLLRVIQTSMLLTAFCVLLSTSSAIVRGLALFVFAIGLFYCFIGSIAPMGSSIVSISLTGNGWTTGCVVLGTLFILALAASRIGSVAENHSLVLRALGFVIGGYAFAGTICGAPVEVSSGMLFMIWAAALALTEHTSEVPSMYASWSKLGLFGRLARRFFVPSWAGGLFFAGAIVTVMALTSSVNPRSAFGTSAHLWTAHFLLYGALVFPVCFYGPLLRNRSRAAFYMIFQVLGSVFGVIGSVLESSPLHGPGAFIVCMHPLSAAWWAMSHGNENDITHWSCINQCTVPMCAAIILIALYRSLKDFKIMAKQERKATETPA